MYLYYYYYYTIVYNRFIYTIIFFLVLSTLNKFTYVGHSISFCRNSNNNYCILREISQLRMVKFKLWCENFHKFLLK